MSLERYSPRCDWQVRRSDFEENSNCAGSKIELSEQGPSPALFAQAVFGVSRQFTIGDRRRTGGNRLGILERSPRDTRHCRT